MSDLKPPTGLKAAGRRLWTEVTGPYVLTPAELAMLEQACRTADELDRLERAVRALPDLTTTGSTGQLRPHPLLAELRAHRQLLERLTAALNLPDDEQPGWLASGSEACPAGGPGALAGLSREQGGLNGCVEAEGGCPAAG